MSEEAFKRLRQDRGQNGAGAGPGPEAAAKTKQQAGRASVPMVSLVQKACAAVTVSVPEVKAISGGRADRRVAKKAQRELARMALTATKTAVAMQAVQSVNTYAVYTLDKAQQEMVDILFGTEREPEMNNLVSQMIGRMLQLTASQLGAYAEIHGKRQMEEL